MFERDIETLESFQNTTRIKYVRKQKDFHCLSPPAIKPQHHAFAVRPQESGPAVKTMLSSCPLRSVYLYVFPKAAKSHLYPATHTFASPWHYSPTGSPLCIK
ncbi:hypothetical protein LXL04_003650 [Taraxacum kok-saghyz]